MKRSLVVVQQQSYDWEAAKQQVSTIAEHFATYLSEFRSRRATGSKHAVLGPVGKLLNRAAAGERNLEALLGYTVRVHEMSSKSGYLSPGALEQLRLGAERLLDLLGQASVAVRSRLIEQVDDAVYYRHQKGYYEWLHAYMAEKQQAFAAFLRRKYSTDGALAEAWGEASGRSHEVPYPSKWRQRNASSKAQADDIKSFWEFLKEAPADEQEEGVE